MPGPGLGAGHLSLGSDRTTAGPGRDARGRLREEVPVDTTPCLFVLVGLPGSGKSTLASQWVAQDPARRARVSRDDLRMMLHSRLAWEQTWQEAQVTAVQHAAIAALLRAGVSVVADATNLLRRHRRALEDIGRAAGARVEIRVVDTPVEECIARDATRPDGRRVGADVIRRLARMAEWPT